MAAFLGAALVIMGAAWVITSRHHGRKTAKVPQLVGLPQQDAKARARAKGFALRVDSEASSKAPGTVLSQVPEPNAVLSRGSTVALVVSLGKAVVSVPNLVGLRSAGAERLLASMDLKGVKSVSPAGSKPPDVVLTQDPRPGLRVAKGAQVSFTVSAGPKLVTVPNVVGLSRAQADAKLRGKGLTPMFVTVQAAVAPVVLSQSPPARSQVPKGTKVRVRISSGTGVTPGPTGTGTTTTGTTTTVPRPPAQ